MLEMRISASARPMERGQRQRDEKQFEVRQGHQPTVGPRSEIT